MHEKHTTQKKTQENLRVDATYHRWNFRQKKTNKLQKKNKHSLLFDPICKFVRTILELFELHVLYHISLFIMQYGIGSIFTRLILHMFDDYKFLLVCFFENSFDLIIYMSMLIGYFGLRICT